MNQARHVRIYDLHSWTGVTLGLFVYVVAFTGCWALFHHELKAWEDPAARLVKPAEPVAFQPLFDELIANEIGDRDISFVNVTFPDAYEPYYKAHVDFEAADGERGHVDRRWDAATGEALPDRGDGLALWLLDFHRDLMWPDQLGGRQVGRSLVGIAGVILLLSIVSGVVTHSKLMRELFSLRYMQSVRLKWQDTHKIIGLWGLPFHAMIAFTGAFLGVIVLILPVMAMLVVKGDQNKLIDAIGAGRAPPSGVAAEMIAFDDVRAMRHERVAGPPVQIFVSNYGDAAAVYQLGFAAEERLVIQEASAINAATGERDTSDGFLEDTAVNRTFAAVTPLHYGTYGGIALKLLYASLGLSLAIITATGMMMWIERRLHGNEGKKSKAFYRGLSRVTVGVTTGLAVASVALFYHDKLYAGAEQARLTATGGTYFGVWAAVVVYAFLRRSDYRATKEMTALAGLGLMGLPVLNGVVTGDFAWEALNGGHAVTAGVDVTLFLCGLLALAAAVALPARRDARHQARTADGAATAPAE
ncbi:MAG: PepSY domain-containing protein [Caulobacterales bacterium]|nr:PepSY domain-containing protein [Caulobacterales bacterium]